RHADRRRRAACAPRRAPGALQDPARLRVHRRAAARRCGQDPAFRPPGRAHAGAVAPTRRDAVSEERMNMTLPFDAFDADNHYYEATDAFPRHLPAEHAKVVQWAEIGGKPRMIVDNKVFRFIPNPTFDPVARPGSLDEYFRGRV